MIANYALFLLCRESFNFVLEYFQI